MRRSSSSSDDGAACLGCLGASSRVRAATFVLNPRFAKFCLATTSLLSARVLAAVLAGDDAAKYQMQSAETGGHEIVRPSAGSEDLKRAQREKTQSHHRNDAH